MNRIYPILPAFLTFALFATPLPAQQDTVVYKNGQEQKGTITKYLPDEKKVEFDSEGVRAPYPLDTFRSITLAPRPEYKTAVTDIKEKKYQDAVNLLEPMVNNYLGMDANWIIDAALKLAQGYNGVGKRQQCLDLYDRIAQAYPSSPLGLRGDIGKARDLIRRKVWGDALDLVAKVEAKLPEDAKTAVPEDLTKELLSDIYFIRGEAYEGQGKKQDALTAYLKVSTLYMEPEDEAKEAQTRADKLRQENPGLRVE